MVAVAVTLVFAFSIIILIFFEEKDLPLLIIFDPCYLNIVVDVPVFYKFCAIYYILGAFFYILVAFFCKLV